MEKNNCELQINLSKNFNRENAEKKPQKLT